VRGEPSGDPRRRARACRVAALVLALLLGREPAASAEGAGQACERAVLLAGAKYSACVLRARADAAPPAQPAYGPCENRLAKRVQAAHRKFGSACPQRVWTGRGQRFVDLGDGTVRDELTGLQWEKKRNLDGTPQPDDPHDADNVYTWTATRSGKGQDGTAFATFLTALNRPSRCFAMHCDWRLPSLHELQMLLLSPMPCGVSPCLDPIFGPTAASTYWSGTESVWHPVRAWYVVFSSGYVTTAPKVSPYYVRAVRGGQPRDDVDPRALQ
jgi:hypothetical protein